MGGSGRNVPKVAALNVLKSRRITSLRGPVVSVGVFFIYVTVGIAVADAGTLSVYIVPNLYVKSRINYTPLSLLSCVMVTVWLDRRMRFL